MQYLHSLNLPLTELERDKRSIRNLWLRLFMLLKRAKSVFKLWNVLSISLIAYVEILDAIIPTHWSASKGKPVYTRPPVQSCPKSNANSSQSFE